ncbi:hypothetical protein [Spiroplasma endosymbiont of Poecilobothrus nobilitatus]|uniref:hypothetical protein n=1 Tax=Spiroplasma endosymbiont of Poecilobothrus nobilitatus TaxID=1209220 RepID=UPI00313B779F
MRKNRNSTEIKNINLISDVKNNMLYFKDNRVAKVWKITAKDISLLTQNDRNNTIYNLATIFKTLRLDFDIVKIEQPYNFNAQYQNLVHVSNKWEFNQETNASVEEQLLNYGEQLNQIEKDIHWQEAIYYLVVYDTNYESLEQQTKYIINNYNADIKFYLASENEIKTIIYQLTNPYFKDYVLPNKIIQKSNYLQVDNGFMGFLSVN